MPEPLDISLTPQTLDEGAPEEKAAFGDFIIRSSSGSLTVGFDCILNSYRLGPLVSGYHAAEWFAWNWWRLRWEPKSDSADWPLAHQINTIGEGYVWPNVTISSDGLRTTLISSPSARPDAKPFRYVGALPLAIPSAAFEAAVDVFIVRIIGRLREQAVPNTNDVLAERKEPELALGRRLEARLGRDPDAVDDNAIDQLLADSSRLGKQSLEEIAAEAGRTQRGILTADALEQIVQDDGYDAEPRDTVRLSTAYCPAKKPDIPAWKVGAEAAKALREQEKLENAPIPKRHTRPHGRHHRNNDFQPAKRRAPPRFRSCLIKNPKKARVVLRSRWPQGRRFDLARLIGDRLIISGGALHPATRASTYRQKAQRSFAAELLSPFDAVDRMLAGDYSAKKQHDVAEHFNVSEKTIEALLKNHGKIERDGWDWDFEPATTAAL